MRAGYTRAPYYQQTRPGACLPACARMVLAHLGDVRAEESLAKTLASYEFGTPASNIRKLTQLGYRVVYGSMQWEDLAAAIQANLHPIVFVDAQFLPWADFMGFHAVVVDMIEATQIEVLDPADASGPHQLSKDGFLLAWAEFDQRAAIVSRS